MQAKTTSAVNTASQPPHRYVAAVPRVAVAALNSDSRSNETTSVVGIKKRPMRGAKKEVVADLRRIARYPCVRCLAWHRARGAPVPFMWHWGFPRIVVYFSWGWFCADCDYLVTRYSDGGFIFRTNPRD